MGISGFFVVPHDAVLHRQVLELAVVADSHVRADGAVLDGDILPDDARGNQPGIVNGIRWSTAARLILLSSGSSPALRASIPNADAGLTCSRTFSRNTSRSRRS